MAEKTANHSYGIGQSFTLSSISEELKWTDDSQISDYEFTHWTSSVVDSEPFYSDKSSVTFNSKSSDLYAQWEKVWFRFTYNKNDGLIANNLIFGGVSGIEHKFDTTDILINGNLSYKSASYPYSVTKPYSDNSELSDSDNLRFVDDINGGISSIGGYSFNGCTNLTSVTCPNVDQVAIGAFTNCSSLSSVSVASDNANFTLLDESNNEGKSGIVLIDRKGNTVLWGSIPKCKNVVLPSYVRSIDNFAFVKCINLSSVYCPSVLSIGEEAFCDCRSLTSLDCPHAVRLYNRVFWNPLCYPMYLKQINLSAVGGVTIIGDSTFDTSQKLTAIVPEGLVDDFRAAPNWAAYLATENLTLSGV